MLLHFKGPENLRDVVFEVSSIRFCAPHAYEVFYGQSPQRNMEIGCHDLSVGSSAFGKRRNARSQHHGPHLKNAVRHQLAFRIEQLEIQFVFFSDGVALTAFLRRRFSVRRFALFQKIARAVDQLTQIDFVVAVRNPIYEFADDGRRGHRPNHQMAIAQGPSFLRIQAISGQAGNQDIWQPAPQY